MEFIEYQLACDSEWYPEQQTSEGWNLRVASILVYCRKIEDITEVDLV